jgi:DNA-directed RNA polymerase II subunit RPB2
VLWERDCLIAHGITKFLKESMMDRSDLFRAFVSKKEETIIIGNSDKRIYRFNNQNLKEDEVNEIQLPYAMKLLYQELESMGLDIRVQVT